MSDLGNREVFAENLSYYMDRLGKDRAMICADLGLKYTTFADWENAKTYPRIDKIEMLANYFGIKKTDLIESRSSGDRSFDDVKEMFLTLSQAKKEQALDYILGLTDNPALPRRK